jgi:hypoxanthine-guanine phosphoribosyltransferase
VQHDLEHYWCDCVSYHHSIRLPHLVWWVNQLALTSCTAAATIKTSYETEYSTDSIEMHADAVTPGQRVLLVDDLIATGGTLNAGIALIRELGCLGSGHQCCGHTRCWHISYGDTC